MNFTTVSAIGLMNKAIERIKTSLEIEEDINLHITGWIVQRIGWFLMLVFLLSAALGLFGNGVLSHKRITTSGVTLQYEKFTRFENDTEIEIQADSQNGFIEVALSDQFTRHFKIDRIIPEPGDQKIIQRAKVFVFPAAGKGEITFFVMAREKGRLHTAISINGIDFQYTNFIYP